VALAIRICEESKADYKAFATTKHTLNVISALFYICDIFRYVFLHVPECEAMLLLGWYMIQIDTLA
jgi:hypothetical protein